VDRRAFIAGATGGLVFTPLAVTAQTSGTVYRVGFLLTISEGFPTESPLDKAFVEGLRDNGFIGGQNIVFEVRSAAGRLERLSELAAELVRLKCDVIVVTTTPPALAVRQATTTIPIVTTAVADPVRAGLAASLAKPGGNVTGISVVAGEHYTGKQLQLLAEAVPKKRVAILRHAPNPGTAVLATQAQRAAETLGLTSRLIEIGDPDELKSAFVASSQWRADSLFVIGDAVFSPAGSSGRRLLALAVEYRLPAMYWAREMVAVGGLMAYAVNYRDLYRRAAGYVAKLLRGAKPADLPIEQPTKFEFIINLKTAKLIGLTIPPSVLARADELIR
jgi:putative tryptophan/tyrosine transport system substrate-binding protein